MSDGHCLKSKEVSSGKTAEKFFFHLFEAIDATLLEEHKSLSIAFAGPIFEGKILGAPNFPFFSEIQNFPEILAQKYKRPVSIINDAHAFALGEAKLRNTKNVIGVTLGTGLGVGIFLNGNIFSGAHGFAGEIGHATSDVTNGKKEVEDFLRAKAFSESGHELYFTSAAHFFANLILHFDPDILVIGGGFGKNALPQFLPKILKKTKKYLAKKKVPLDVKIQISTHQNSGAYGAAMS